MNAEDAIKLFQQKVDAGEAVNLKTGGTGPMSRATRDSIVSTVRNAYRRAADTSELSQIRHEAVAAFLEAAVVEDAREHGRTHPNNESNRVRRFLATVEGKVRRRAHAHTASIPEAWHDLYELRTATDHPRHAGSAIRRMAQVAALYGRIHRPEDLPRDQALVVTWFTRAGATRGKAMRCLGWYDRIRKLHSAGVSPALLPDLTMPPHSERGIRGLPDLVQRLEAAGYTGSPRELSVEDTIALIAPAAYEALRGYLDDPDENRRRRGDTWKKQARGAVSRFLAAAMRNKEVMAHLASSGLDEKTLRPSDLVLLQMPHLQIDAVGADDWESRHLGGTRGGTITVEETLFVILAEDMAVESAKRSPLVARNSGGDRGLYTETVLQDVGQLLRVTEHEGKQKLFAHRGDLRELAKFRIRAFQSHAARTNQEVGIGNRKGKENILLQVTLPQLAVIGLPALAQRVEELEQHYFAAAGRHGPGHPTTHRARRRYHYAERGYVVLSLLLEDAMRLANYAGARVGTAALRDEMVEGRTPEGEVVRSRIHVIPTLERDANGNPNGFRCLEMGFHGNDHPNPRLKIELRDGNPRSRARTVQGWIMDLERFWKYFVGQRVDDLVAQGFLGSVIDYDIKRDLK